MAIPAPTHRQLGPAGQKAVKAYGLFLRCGPEEGETLGDAVARIQRLFEEAEREKAVVEISR